MEYGELSSDEESIWQVVVVGGDTQSDEAQVLDDALAMGKTMGVDEDRVREIFKSAWQYACSRIASDAVKWKF